MKIVRVFIPLLILFLISCNGKYLKKQANEKTIKIGNLTWHYNSLGFEEALKEAKKNNKFILAVFSSKG